jgi:NDP-sugar pyrophosphorylase family protein
MHLSHSTIMLYRDIPLHPHSSRVPWDRPSNYLKDQQTVLGENTDFAEQVVVKQCSIGNNVKIGGKTKLNNCIIMDNVTIGDK